MAMSDNDWQEFHALSDLNFLNFIRTIYETNITHSKWSDFDLEKKEKLLTEIFHRLHSFDSNAINLCLQTFTSLAQQCDDIEPFTQPMILESLQKLAGLQCDQIDVDPPEIKNTIEAEKCMSYLIHTSPMVQKFYSISGLAEAITQRIKETTERKLNDEIRFFDMRMLFLLTAFNPEIRQRIRETFHGLSYLLEIINQIILAKSEQMPSADSDILLSHGDIRYLIEILKTLDNLTIDLPNLTRSSEIQEEEEAHLMRLVSILRELILCYGPTADQQMELRHHIIHLLTNMPSTCYEELLSPVVPEDENGNDGKNIDAIDIILHFLDDRITKMEENKTIKESLVAVLQLLIFMCQANRTIRKCSRQLILPSICGGDFDLSSNEDQTLQDKLIRLMISANPELKRLSTKFMFILCKENVNRLIKYTGLTNVNELNLQESAMKDQYSSDSDQFEPENERILDDSLVTH